MLLVLGDDRVHARADRPRVGDVQRIAGDAAAGGQAAQFLLQPLAVPVRDDHGRAAVGEDRGERVAEAGRSPGDERDLIAHVEQVLEDAHQAVRLLLKKRSRFTFGIVMATTSAAP